MADVEASENDSLYDLVQAKKKLPSLSWKQKVIGFAITAGLAAFFAILVSEFNVSCLHSVHCHNSFLHNGHHFQCLFTFSYYYEVKCNTYTVLHV